MCGDEENVLDEKTREAVRAFQQDNGLDPIADDAAVIDKKTQDKIEEKYTE